MTTTLRDLAVTLAHEYGKDTGPDFPTSALVRIGQATPDVPLGILAMQLSMQSDSVVDLLLCGIDHYAHPDLSSHDMCCDYECDCARPNTTFAHPMCETCQQAPAERLDGLVQDLLLLVPTRMKDYIAHLLYERNAA